MFESKKIREEVAGMFITPYGDSEVAMNEQPDTNTTVFSGSVISAAFPGIGTVFEAQISGLCQSLATSAETLSQGQSV